MCVCIYIVDTFFFFFKQKTAYEMRISDWSSDVCSSDLPDHQHVPDITDMGRQAKRGRSRRAGMEQRWPIEMVISRRPSPHRRQRHEEIGRASCRERVCQYV